MPLLRKPPESLFCPPINRYCSIPLLINEPVIEVEKPESDFEVDSIDDPSLADNELPEEVILAKVVADR